MDDKFLTVLSYELADFYRVEGNWNAFAHHPRALEEFLNQRVWQKIGNFMPRGEYGKRLPSPPPPIKPVILFNSGHVQIAGPRLDKMPKRSKPIRVDERIIGWVSFISGPRPPSFFSRMLDEGLEILYVIILILFFWAGIVSYILSKHILAPVNARIQSTQALNRFNFKNRIQVKTGDELGRLASNFNRMACTLERYEVEKKQWIVDISHELRTPLAILKGEIEAVMDGIRPQGMKQMNILHREVCQLETIVNDLHLLSRADAKTLTLKMTPVRPALILEQVLKDFELHLAQKRIHPHIQFTHSDFSLKADEARLRQVFSNILDNALKFSVKPATLFIRDYMAFPAYQIEIEDQGPGVPPENLERIFNRLFKTDRSRNRDIPGSGLGLSICRSIMKIHNGAIWAEPNDQGGLRIIVQFSMEEE